MQTALQAVQSGHEPSQESASDEPRRGAVASLTLPERDLPVISTEEELTIYVRQLDPKTTLVIPSCVSISEVQTGGHATVVIYGNLSGPIDAGAKPVYVMPGGSATGPIRSSAEVFVAGEVGKDPAAPAVQTDGRFVLAETGRVHGDVEYRSLRVHEGGIISGRLLPAPLSAP